MLQYSIDNAIRMQMFLAQIGHESAELRYVEELADGHAYEGRKDLGNTQEGDGVKFKGRGLIQLTGRKNYELCGMGMGLDLLNHPELLAQPENAVYSACWFWSQNQLNPLCDAGFFKELTRRINGGMNGFENRMRLLQRAQQVIK